MESAPYVLSFRMVFFYLVTTVWIFDVILCENSINQSNGLRRPGGLVGNLETFWRWDVSSNPGNWDFPSQK